MLRVRYSEGMYIGIFYDARTQTHTHVTKKIKSFGDIFPMSFVGEFSVER